MRPKDIGTRMESKIRDVINDWAGWKVCERVALHGNNDHGDLRILVDELVLTGESKHCKEYPSEGMLDDFKAQTITENVNAGQDGGVLFVNLTNRSVQRWEAWMQKSTFLKLHGLDRVIERYELDDAAKARLEQLLIDTKHDWLRLTMAAFMHLCWGSPAWGEGE